jgi:hypothetical protein
VARSDNARSAPIDKREAAEAASLFCAQVHSHVARLEGAANHGIRCSVLATHRCYADIAVAGSTCAISARCLTTRSPCLIPHAIERSSVAGSSAQRRHASAR